MASNEHRILCKVITEKTIQPLLNRGVTEYWFYLPDERAAFAWIKEHHEKYGNTPSRTTVQHKLGKDYKIYAVPETFDYLLDEMANSARWSHAKGTVLDVTDHLNDNDTDGAVRELEEGLTRIRSFSPVSTHLVNSMDHDRLEERWDEYDRRKTTTGLIGFSTGFPTIDAATLGLQKGQLVTILGQPKAGKTSILIVIANHIYAEYEVPVLFTTFEMSVRELENRQEALMAKVNFTRLQQGALTKLEEKAYDDWLTMAQTTYTWPFHFMDISAGGTVSAVEAMIDKHDPAVVFIDGIYMMTDEVTGEQNSWEAITNITRSLKRVAAKREKPIVINSQALRSKSKGERLSTHSAGYSSSFGQDSDVVIGIERVQPARGEDETTHAYERILRILASRNSGLVQTELIFDYDEGNIEEIT